MQVTLLKAQLMMEVMITALLLALLLAFIKAIKSRFIFARFIKDGAGGVPMRLMGTIN